MSEESGVEGELHGRRSVIKKAAVAGAVAWTVPSIVSVTSAGADSPDCEGNCLGVVVGNAAVYEGSDVWRVPLSFAGACPNCFQLISLGNAPDPDGGFTVNNLGNSFAFVTVFQDHLEISIQCNRSTIGVNVSFPVTISCNNTQSTCCVQISGTLTKINPPNLLCDQFTSSTFTSSVTQGAC
jgi:hypothetical protein